MSPLIVANWKEYGTQAQAKEWLDGLAKEHSLLNNIQIIVCPPFTALSTISEVIKKEGLPIAIGAQDLSRFEEGKHTGEISPKMLAEFITHIIIGHSERRNEFSETDQIVAEKVAIAKKYNLTTIVCVSNIEQVISLKNLLADYKDIIAYEPLFAIGTGTPDTPENANGVAQKIKEVFPGVKVIYGGSVDGTNVTSFLLQKNLSGALVGNRSIDSNFFLEILKHAK